MVIRIILIVVGILVIAAYLLGRCLLKASYKEEDELHEPIYDKRYEKP